MNTTATTNKTACPHCGKPHQAGAKFCGGCGAALQQASAGSGSQSAAKNSPFRSPPAPPPNRAPLMPPAAQAPGGAASAPGLLSRMLGVFAIVANPGGLLKSRLVAYPWQWALAISGTAFLLFFLQTGLDLSRAGQAGAGRVAGLALTGLVYGTLGVALLGGVAWVLARPFGGGSRSVGWVIRAFCLGYSAALIYGVLGLAANLLLGWNTAVAFGITGALWALGPMTAAVNELIDNKPWAGAAVATLCGGLLLFGWAWLGGIST